MTMTPLLPQRDTGAASWDDVPELATCSYEKYTRWMGTAVRITRMAPRGVPLPNPRYTDRPHWPVVRALIPGGYFHTGLSGEAFRDLYLADLEARGPGLIEAQLRAVDLDWVDTGAIEQRLVLCCFETDVTNPLACHRRLFARWWQERTGRDVPELS